MTGAFGWHLPIWWDTSLPEIGWWAFYGSYNFYYSRNALSSFGAQKNVAQNRQKSFWHMKKAEPFGSATMRIAISRGFMRFPAQSFFAVSLAYNDEAVCPIIIFCKSRLDSRNHHRAIRFFSRALSPDATDTFGFLFMAERLAECFCQPAELVRSVRFLKNGVCRQMVGRRERLMELRLRDGLPFCKPRERHDVAQRPCAKAEVVAAFFDGFHFVSPFLQKNYFRGLSSPLTYTRTSSWLFGGACRLCFCENHNSLEIVIFRAPGAGNPLLFPLLAFFRYNRATGAGSCTESHERKKICDEIQQKNYFPSYIMKHCIHKGQTMCIMNEFTSCKCFVFFKFCHI